MDDDAEDTAAGGSDADAPGADAQHETADAEAQVVAEAEALLADSAAATDAEATAATDAGEPIEPTMISEDAVVALIAERDEYLDALQRLKAEFANARRRNAEQASSQRQQAAAELVEKLLPVLDSCDAAVSHGIAEVEPIAAALFDVLKGQGLTRLDPTGEPFDPEQHEAVMHEAGEGEPTVAETLRTGYAWNERVLRPAMVKVQG